MAPDERLDRTPTKQGELLAQFQQAISGLGPTELQGVLQSLLALGSLQVDPFDRTPPPSRRRARRAEVVTYRVRIH